MASQDSRRDELVRVEVADGIATLWLNRPERRNAISSELVATLPVVASTTARRPDVQVLVVTGTDPAFCAGLDLVELGTTGDNLGLPQDPPYPWPWDSLGKPVIGAVNGPAVAGGLELALHCDLLIASDRARFADTHTRVGQVPGAGLTVYLPRLVGPARAREMSFTGNFVSADTALAWGLVNHVVPHEELLPFARALARDIAGNDPDAVVAINRLYDLAAGRPPAEALAVEADEAVAWQAAHDDPAVVAGRRESILARAHRQLEGLGSGPDRPS